MPPPPKITRRVAASTRTRQLIAGELCLGRVLGVFPSAVYVEFATEAGTDLLAVETADGLRLPRAATLAATSGARPLAAVRVGDEAQSGEGHLDVGPLAFDVVRWWSPQHPRAVPTMAYDDERLTAVSALLPALPQDLLDRLASLTTALVSARPDDVADAVNGLLGLGPGLTPEGDDVLAGLLVTLSTVADLQPLTGQLRYVVASQAAARTTTLSAALLRDAADGFAVPALVDLVNALVEGDEGTGRTATQRTLADVDSRFLAVGHTSGAALAHGAVAAARLNVAAPTRGEGVLT
jgi:hypothetical protein